MLQRSYGLMSYADNYQDCIILYLQRLKWCEKQAYYRKSFYQFLKNKEKYEQVRAGKWTLDLGPVFYINLIWDGIVKDPIEMIEERYNAQTY